MKSLSIKVGCPKDCRGCYVEGSFYSKPIPAEEDSRKKTDEESIAKWKMIDEIRAEWVKNWTDKKYGNGRYGQF